MNKRLKKAWPRVVVIGAALVNNDLVTNVVGAYWFSTLSNTTGVEVFGVFVALTVLDQLLPAVTSRVRG